MSNGKGCKRGKPKTNVFFMNLVLKWVGLTKYDPIFGEPLPNAKIKFPFDINQNGII